MPLALSTRVKLPKLPLWHDPWTHPIQRTSSLLPSGNEQENPLLVSTPSCYSTSPSKALPEFFLWPLINLY